MMEDVGSAEEQWDNSPVETPKEKRGNFLTTICTLSWVSQAMAGSSALLMLFQGRGNLEEQLTMMNKLVDKEQTGVEFLDSMLADSVKIMELTIMNFVQLNLMNLLVVSTGALAVYLMFKLKKAGFFVYILYCIAELYVVYHFFGDLGVMVMSMAVTGIASIVFIILYAVNLKRMTE